MRRKRSLGSVCVCVCVGVLGAMTWGIGEIVVYSRCGGSFEEDAQLRSAPGLAKCTAKTRNKCHYFMWGVHAATRCTCMTSGPGAWEHLFSNAKAEAQMSAVSYLAWLESRITTVFHTSIYRWMAVGTVTDVGQRGGCSNLQESKQA